MVYTLCALLHNCGACARIGTLGHTADLLHDKSVASDRRVLQCRTNLEDAAVLDARVGDIVPTNSDDLCPQLELGEKMPQVHVVMGELEVRPDIPYLVKAVWRNGYDFTRHLFDDVVRDAQLH